MSKKHKARPKRSGWPQGAKQSPEASPLHDVQRIANRLERNTVTQEEFERYVRRLRRILREWREFRLIRPDLADLQARLGELPEAEREAVHDPEKGQRRASRGRNRLLRGLFEAELIEELLQALLRAAARAGSPDDIGALGVAYFSLAAHNSRSLPPENNPLLTSLLEIAFEEFDELTQVVREIEAASQQAEGQEPADEAERERRRTEALAAHPVIQRDAERRMYRLAQRLSRYVEDGTIRAHLTAEELAPIVSELRQTAQAADGSQETAAARASTLAGTIQQFAQEPANEEAFRRFGAELAAQAKEAQDAGDPAARRLGALADICRFDQGGMASLRIVVTDASLRRLRREGKLSLTEPTPEPPAPQAEAEGPKEQADGEAPPA